ncbi:MAG TPA: isoleucine--tRNA ligase [Clostridiales bacterium]|nr:isoleucine--tRNA ligase [Clostridiales bacterium]
MDYGKTLNLPETDFPMRGNLPQKEPGILAQWEKDDIYHQSLALREGQPTYILHDGPPYANGDIHLGHALNKVLKDIIIKYHTMAGYQCPYIPGWDTHGLPIEQRAIKALGLNRKQTHVTEFRDKCKEFALQFVDIQREEFKRLGVRGDWDHPYITLKPEYEAVQIGIFGEMAQKGYIYKGLKPVYWCPDCETALAEAEVEYADHKSPSIYVKFSVKDTKGKVPQDACFVIWTTTPWTIPANVAICLNTNFTYCLLKVNGESWIVGKPLLQLFLKDTGITDYEILEEYSGADLEKITCYHPLWADRESLVILGDHVTDEAGTGAVHTAPGHGADDFMVGKKYDLPVISPLDNSGRFTAEAREFQGLSTNEGNKAVVKTLEDSGKLIKLIFIKHQYPHCWRCKEPILFRATEQWFASIDGFRQKALAEIDKVRWIPSWGRDRIYNMIRDRGDWCISRQRTWGVPIPIFYCKDCGKAIINEITIRHLQKLFREEGGSQVWFAKEAKDLLPAGFTCDCGCNTFDKEKDIMDVWFDSGSSFAAVIENNPDIKGDIDLYLEGSDQHRGWFNSSLSISVATRGKAPYKGVLTHGFLVDEKGHKQSKSLGNTVDPLKVIEKMGADVLRLWVSSADYRNDLACSDGILKQVSEAYRKLRNTMRFLMGNLYDFDAKTEKVPYTAMKEIDRYALHLLEELNTKTVEAYENYEFHSVFHLLHHFCVVDMSAFYLDIIKDRLYVSAKDDEDRKAAQTVLYEALQALVRLMMPILSFTTEEIWSYIRTEGEPLSVQLLDLPQISASYHDEALAAKWARLIAIREEVTKAAEAARRDKVIGHSLDAAVTVIAGKEDFALLQSVAEEFADICIVSEAVIKESADAEIKVEVTAAKGEKCSRCWKYREDLDADGLCVRCSEVIKDMDLSEIAGE